MLKDPTKNIFTFKEFKKQCVRKDSSKNNKLHFLSSRLSAIFAYFLYKIGLSADQVTVLFGICGVLSAYMIFHDMPLIGYFFWRIHIVVDMADGNIARAPKIFNKNAKVVDKMTHVLVNLMIFSSLFLSQKAVTSNIDNIKLFIILLPLYTLYFILDIFIASLGKKSKINFPPTLPAIITKNICTQEGMILVMVTVSYLTKNYPDLSFISSSDFYNYLFSFYIFTYLFALLIKIQTFKKFN